MSTTAIQTIEENAGQLAVPVLSSSAIRAQVNEVQRIMNEIMIEKQLYGKVLGCGDKDVLYLSWGTKARTIIPACSKIWYRKKHAVRRTS